MSNPLSRRRFVTVTAKSAAVALGGYLVVETAMASASEQHRPTLDTVISAAREAMGEPNTIRYAGRGRNGFYGQTLTAGTAWPLRSVSNLVRTIDYRTNAASDEIIFAQPTFGGQKQETYVRGDRAWDVAFVPPGMLYTVVSGIPDHTELTPQIAEATRRQLDILMTPHGFLRAAAAAGSSARLHLANDGSATISFPALGMYHVSGTLTDGLVTKVTTQVPDPVLGDTELTATYSGYTRFGALRAPTRIVHTQGGFPIWDIDVARVDTAESRIEVPDSVATATVPPVWVSPTRLAPGVWYLTGGITHSLAVEFPRYIAVIEAPTDEARSLAVIDTIRTLIPSKPIRYVVTTHHHFDHIGGLRTYVAQGATVVTHSSNVPFLSQSLVAPATIRPDAQSVAPRRPRFEPVTDKRLLEQGDRTIEIYSTRGDNHTNELVIAYLPAEGILMEADSYSPAPPGSASAAGYPPPNALALWDNIQRLGLDVHTIAAAHGSGPVTMADFAAFLGK